MKKVALLVLASMFCVLPFVAACGASSSHSSTSSTSYRTTEETVPAARVVPETSPSVDEIIAAREASAAETSAAEEATDVIETETETEMEADEATVITPVPEVIDTEPPTNEAEGVPETTPTPSPQGVDYHNFINGTTFNLTAYAEALGCRRVQDPEYPKLIMYVVSRPTISYYFLHGAGTINIYFGDSQNRCWCVSGISSYNTDKNYTIKSEGQDDFVVNQEILDAIGKTLYHLVTADPVDLFALPSQSSYAIERREGNLNYYPGGMINEREWGYGIPEDCYVVEPQEGKVYKTDGRVDITGATFDPATL